MPSAGYSNPHVLAHNCGYLRGASLLPSQKNPDFYRGTITICQSTLRISNVNKFGSGLRA